MKEITIENLGVDLGFGDTKIAYLLNGENFVTFKIPSIIQKVNNEIINQIKKGLIGDVSKSTLIRHLMVNINNENYLVGNLAYYNYNQQRAYDVNRNDVISQNISYVLFYSSLLLASVLVAPKVTFNDIADKVNINNVVFGIPAQFYIPEYLTLYSDILYKIPENLELLNINKKVNINLGSIIFIEQPLGSGIYCVKERAIKRNETVMIIDIGYRTGDIIIVNFEDEKTINVLYRYTDPNLSVYSFLTGIDFARLFLKHKIEFTRNEKIEEEIALKEKIEIGSNTIDFSNEMKEEKNKFVNSIANKILKLKTETRATGIENVTKGIITGGGALFFGNLFYDYFFKNLFPVFIPDNPEFANVKGYVLYGELIKE